MTHRLAQGKEIRVEDGLALGRAVIPPELVLLVDLKGGGKDED